MHLHVLDVERSKAFYERYFELSERVRRGDILFLRNTAGFDLALAPAPDAALQALPHWFHFGFRLQSSDAVVALHARMVADGVTLRRPLVENDDYVTFQCVDRDGHAIEVYWE